MHSRSRWSQLLWKPKIQQTHDANATLPLTRECDDTVFLLIDRRHIFGTRLLNVFCVCFFCVVARSFLLYAGLLISSTSFPYLVCLLLSPLRWVFRSLRVLVLRPNLFMLLAVSFFTRTFQSGWICCCTTISTTKERTEHFHGILLHRHLFFHLRPFGGIHIFHKLGHHIH